MKRLIYIFISLLLLTAIADATARRAKMQSKPARLRELQHKDNLVVVQADSTTIRFSGYDKAASSDYETFFVTNLSNSDTLRRFEAEINYTDESGRQLHSRTITKECDIPPGQTRNIDIRAWDRQHSFRYYLSRDGRKPATPYYVHITPTQCWYLK